MTSGLIGYELSAKHGGLLKLDRCNHDEATSQDAIGALSALASQAGRNLAKSSLTHTFRNDWTKSRTDALAYQLEQPIEPSEKLVLVQRLGKAFVNIVLARFQQDSPAERCKERDSQRCVDCGCGQRTVCTNAAGQPSMIFLHAAHVHPLDPDPVEPIEGQRLRARCASCHGSYDAYWRERQAELAHQMTMHRLLISRFVMCRFSTVV